MAEWGVARKKAASQQKSFSRQRARQASGSNLAASGIFFEMLRSRETCCWMPAICTRDGPKFGMSSRNDLSCSASLADEDEKKKRIVLWLRQSLICFV